MSEIREEFYLFMSDVDPVQSSARGW
jgi:hypothetical protein